jgi:hypothetical protein
MSDNISLVETDQIDEKIQKILRQTDYTEETAFMKLKEYNYDEIAVIKAYMGITEKKAPERPVPSVNQEIYRQLRHKLDSNMRDYQVRVDRGEVKKIV